MNRNPIHLIMSGKKLLLLGAAGLAGAAVLSVWAISAGNPPVLRTTALLTGVAQRPLTQLSTIDVLPLSGATLVNLAMGRDIGITNFPEQVLALTVACDLRSANLVVFDQSTSNTLLTVTTNLNFDFAQSPVSNPSIARELGSTNQIVRFIARLQILPSTNSDYALLGGVLTVAGRAYRDTTTGCLGPVPVQFDRTPYDKTFLDKDISQKKDRDRAKYTARTGLAHVIGFVNIASASSARLTNTVLIPAGNLSLRRSAEIIK